MSNPIRQVVSGQMQSVTRGVINNVAGNIKGMIGMGKDNSPGAALQNKSKFFTENLQYPINVEGDPMQGHYVLFMINQADGKNVVKSKKSNKMAKIKSDIQRDLGVRIKAQGGRQEFADFGQAVDDDGIFIDAAGDQVDVKNTGAADRFGERTLAGASTSSLLAESTTTTRLGTAIALYMPASIATSYSMEYSDVEVGPMSDAVSKLASMMKDAFGGEFNQEKFGDLVGTTNTAVKRVLLKGMDAVVPGVRARAEIASGVIMSNKMEMAFRGINRRSFSYSFVFMPKSEQEVQVVQKIIHLFKFHAHGQFGKGHTIESKDKKGKVSKATGFEMTLPDTFDIRYMYQGQANTHMNKISECYLKNVEVSYGGDRFVAYKPTESLHGGSTPPPQRTTLNLTFQELEILDKKRIDEGF